MQNRQNRHLVKRIIFHRKNHPRMIAGIILSTRMIVLVVYYRPAFGRLLDAFWMPLLVTFWMPFGSRDVPGAHFCEFVSFYDFWNVTGVKTSHHFDTILDILPSWWRYVFCRFLGCVIFSHFAVSGSIWEPIWEPFWGTWEPWK